MSTSPELALVALADPLSERTWSGTPRRIADALASHGCEVGGVAAGGLPAAGFVYALASAVVDGGEPRSWTRTGAARRLHARRAHRQLERLAPRAALHLSSLALPGRREPWPTYLFTAATLQQQAAADERLTARALRRWTGLEARAVRAVDHVFTTSAAAREGFVTEGVDPGRISVVGSGRGGIDAYDGPKDYANGRLLFVAKERRRDKGLPLLLRAFELAVTRSPHLELVIAGPRDPLTEGIDHPRIRVTGYLDGDELQQQFEAASLFVMPAPNEPWGLVYLEALACRTPLLGLRRGAFPELAGEGRYGWIAEEPTPEAVADTIVAATSDPGGLAARGAAGQRTCLADYRWDRVAERILDVHDRVTAGWNACTPSPPPPSSSPRSPAR